jgi:DNA-binding transcriptional LysR family regulator
MDPRRLNFLVVTSEEGSLRAAGRRLHLSQPQISRGLQELEAEVGVQLLYRTHKGVRLTTAGEELVTYAREILDRMSAARAAMSRIREQRSEALRIGVVAGAVGAGELFAPILSGFRKSRPDVAVEVRDLGMIDQLTPLLEGAVDVGIVREPLQHPDLTVIPIAQEPRIIMMGSSHELAEEDSLDVDDILHFRTLPLSSRPEWCDYWQFNYERGRSNCAPGVPPANTVGEAQMSIASHPVIVGSAAAIGRLAPNPLIRTIPLTGVTPSVIAVAHKRRDIRRAVRDFVDSAQATAERHIDVLPGGTLPER